MNSEKLASLRELYVTYEDELMGFAPIFANQLKDLIIEEKTKKQVVNETPHFSKDFTTSKSRLDSRKSPQLQVELNSLHVDSSMSDSDDEVVEQFCDECQDKHFFHFRKCEVCEEEHDGCCTD